MGQNFDVLTRHVLCVSRFMNLLTRYSTKGTCRNFEEIPLTWILTIRKSLSSVHQVQALGGAFGVKYPLSLQTSCDYGVLFDNNLNVYVGAEERLLVTHAVEQEGVTVDNFISRSRKIKIVRWATCRLSNESVGSWSTFTQCIFMSI
jgi:hypothetical protein